MKKLEKKSEQKTYVGPLIEEKHWGNLRELQRTESQGKINHSRSQKQSWEELGRKMKVKKLFIEVLETMQHNLKQEFQSW